MTIAYRSGARNAAIVAVLAICCCSYACKWRRQRPVDAGAVDARAMTDVDATAGDAAIDSAVAGPLYRSSSGGFQVRFPESKAPEVEDKNVTGGATVHLFKVRYGTSAYVVTYDDVAKGTNRTAAQSLDGAREGLLESTGGTIESDRPLTLGGHPGLELSVSATTAGIKMRQRLRAYVVDGRLYQVLVVAPTWSGATHFEQDFLDSFALLGPLPGSDGGT